MYRYRYLNENWQEIEGDSYELIQDTPICQGENIFMVVKLLVDVGYRDSNNNPVARDRQLEFSTPNNCRYQGFSFTQEVININFTRENGGTYTESKKATDYPLGAKRNNIWISVKLDRINYYRSTPYGVRSVNPLYATDVCSPNNCTFNVYSQKKLILQLVRSSCPEIEGEEPEESDKCPDGTCEVICGNTICCYNSEGISVESFPVSN